jgi:serine/threonine protein kinase
VTASFKLLFHYLTKSKRRDEYAQLLREQKLWPVDPMIEQNWSGRGQHVEFKKDEQWLINDILEVQGNLGNTRTAFVQSVRCRRILLARKTITCGKQTMTREEAITEVSHLTRLNHAHILRVIGSYVKGRELSILLYPVADYNLENFLDEFRDAPGDSDMWNNMVHSSERFYSCLSSAVQCIHRSLTKHMDIKPQNILIRKIDKRRYSPYVADFGIARSYETPKEIETDSRTSFTKRYAAPEVVRQDLRGLSADIFSLGCVFIEIFTTFISEKDHVEWKIDLQAVLDGNALGDTSYQANVKELQAYLSKCIGLSEHFLVVKARLSMFGRMLKVKPRDRPTAESLVTYFGERPCCKTGSVQLQAIANHIPESEG